MSYTFSLNIASSPELKIDALSSHAPEDRVIVASCYNDATGLSPHRVAGLVVLRADELNLTWDKNAAGLAVLS